LLEERHRGSPIQFARESFDKRAHSARPCISNLLTRKSSAGLKADKEISYLIGVHEFADDEHVDLFSLEFTPELFGQF